MLIGIYREFYFGQCFRNTSAEVYKLILKAARIDDHADFWQDVGDPVPVFQ